VLHLAPNVTARSAGDVSILTHPQVLYRYSVRASIAGLFPCFPDKHKSSLQADLQVFKKRKFFSLNLISAVVAIQNCPAVFVSDI